jgi:hypothetical protein
LNLFFYKIALKTVDLYLKKNQIFYLGAIDHELETNIVLFLGRIEKGQTVVDGIQRLHMFIQIEEQELGGFARLL